MTPAMAATSLQGKRVLVTGGSAGIGKATALAFDAQGARVAVMSNEKEPLNAVVAQMKQEGLAIMGDLMKTEDCTRAVDEAIAAFGGLDVLVNNGAPLTQAQLEKFEEPEGFESAFRLQVSTVVATTKAATPELAKSKGCIVNVASGAGLKPGDALMAPYHVAKAAQIMLMQCHARQLAPQGIRVNSVAPAWVNTSAVDAAAAVLGYDRREEMADAIGKLHALGRISEPEEIAASICFLASPAASFITGIALPVDGGAALMGGGFPKPKAQ